VLYIVHFTAFCLGGRFFPVTVYSLLTTLEYQLTHIDNNALTTDSEISSSEFSRNTTFTNYNIIY